MTDTMTLRSSLLLAMMIAGTLLGAGCTAGDGNGASEAAASSPCEAPRRLADLPAALEEASGIAPSRAHPGVLWIINDSDPHLYAVDREGHQLGRVRVPVKVEDWEDLALAPCGTGDCLYIAEMGDNQHDRDDVAILRLPEPDPRAGRTAAPERFAFRYPDGPRDAEALFVLPGERLFVVSKGRNDAVALYRFPPLAAGTTLTLEHLYPFTPGLVQLPDMVTGAGASESGAWVAIRTYAYVDIFAADADAIARERTVRLPLAPLAERQGEGVAITDAGDLYFVSERADQRTAPLSWTRCTL